MVTQNLKLAHAKFVDNNKLIEIKLKEGALVLVKDHMVKAFQPQYVGNYWIVSFKGNQVEVHKSEGGETNWVHITDFKYIFPVENVIKNIPAYQNFGQKTTLQLNLDKIPNLYWEYLHKSTRYHTLENNYMKVPE